MFIPSIFLAVISFPALHRPGDRALRAPCAAPGTVERALCFFAHLFSWNKFFHGSCRLLRGRGLWALRVVFFDVHGGTVADHFGDAGRHVVGVIPDADEGVCGRLGRVLQHAHECFLARLFTQIGVDGDIAAHQTLETGADVAHHTAGAYGDAAHHAVIGLDGVAGKIKRGGYKRPVYHGTIPPVAAKNDHIHHTRFYGDVKTKSPAPAGARMKNVVR